VLFSQTWSIYKKRFFTLMLIMLVPIIVIASLSAFLAIGSTSLIFFIYSKFSLGGLAILPMILIAAIFIGIFILFIQLWGPLALMYAVSHNEERMGFIQAYKISLSKMRPFSWLLFLVCFITLGGFALLIVPGIIFSILFTFAIFIFINEDLRGMNALLKSRDYIKDIWWSVLSRLLVVGLLSFIISLLIGLITPSSHFSITSIVLSSVIKLSSYLLLFPFSTVFLYVLYSNVKEMKRNSLSTVPENKGRVMYILICVFGIVIIPAVVYILYALDAKGPTYDINYPSNQFMTIPGDGVDLNFDYNYSN